MSSISLIWLICLIIFFEGNTYKYLLSGVDVASRYRVTKPVTTKKLSEIAFVLGAIYMKGGPFKYPKVIQIDNGPEFKGEVTKLFEKHNVDIEEQQQNTSILIQHLWKPLTKSWKKCCLNQWMLKSSRTLKKYLKFG